MLQQATLHSNQWGFVLGCNMCLREPAQPLCLCCFVASRGPAFANTMGGVYSHVAPADAGGPGPLTAASDDL
eukprot:1508825-Alexandrium_andersonii.AAC.1